MGGFGEINSLDLGKIVVAEAVRRGGIAPGLVEEVIVGSVLTGGSGQGFGRQVAILAGLPASTSAYSINKVCGSGLKAVWLGAQAIHCRDAEVIVACGVESMSAAPHVMSGIRKGIRMGHAEVIDTILSDGLTDAFENIHMGVTAENIAQRYRLSRLDQDRFACWSQAKAAAAIQSDRFSAEIVPVDVPGRKGVSKRIVRDEHPRPGTTIESLASLKPAFKIDGSVTAGNSSGINDGAAALLLMSRQSAKDLGVKPIGSVRSCASAGVEPSLMGLGPIPATEKALAKARVAMSDIGLIEANEAFAAQSLAVARDLHFPDDRVNVNGGAIALGHPIGASGARILVTLLFEMQKRDIELGLATLCVGGGMGISMIIERA